MKDSLIERNKILTPSGLDARSVSLRKQIVRVITTAGRGHLASAFSLVEILRALYDSVLKYDAANPRWIERDRCILSKGHGCLALYVMLADKGFFDEKELWEFCKPQGMLGGHPEYGKMPGVEASTGSLGHGLPLASGMALHAKMTGRNHRVYVIVGDGECNEGSVWEAAMFAHKHKLDNLTVIVDYNKQQSYDTTFNILDLEPFADKWASFGFAVKDADGHNVEQLTELFDGTPFEKGRPNVVICHTIKGRGTDMSEYNLEWHHKNKVTPEESEGLLAKLEENL